MILSIDQAQSIEVQVPEWWRANIDFGRWAAEDQDAAGSRAREKQEKKAVPKWVVSSCRGKSWIWEHFV